MKMMKLGGCRFRIAESVDRHLDDQGDLCLYDGGVFRLAFSVY